MYVNLILKKQEKTIVIGQTKQPLVNKIILGILAVMGAYIAFMSLVILVRNLGV